MKECIDSLIICVLQVDGVATCEVLGIRALTVRIDLDLAATVKFQALDQGQQILLLFLTGRHDHHVAIHDKF